MQASPQSEVEIERLVQWLVATFENENDLTLEDKTALERIRADASHAHTAWMIRRGDSCDINLPFLAVTPSSPVHLEKHFSPREIAAIFDGTTSPPSTDEARARREDAARRAREEAATKDLKSAEDRRTLRYFAIGVIGFLALLLASILGFSHHEHAAPEQDHKKEMRH